MVDSNEPYQEIKEFFKTPSATIGIRKAYIGHILRSPSSQAELEVYAYPLVAIGTLSKQVQILPECDSEYD